MISTALLLLSAWPAIPSTLSSNEPCPLGPATSPVVEDQPILCNMAIGDCLSDGHLHSKHLIASRSAHGKAQAPAASPISPGRAPRPIRIGMTCASAVSLQ